MASAESTSSTAPTSSATTAKREAMDRVFKDALEVWKKHDYQDYNLWETFQYQLGDYSLEEMEDAYHTTLKDIRTYLRQRGVWVLVTRGSIAAQLHKTAQEEEMVPWTEEEVTRYRLKEGEFNSYAIGMLIKTKFGRTPLDSINQHSDNPSPNAGLSTTPTTSVTAAPGKIAGQASAPRKFEAPALARGAGFTPKFALPAASAIASTAPPELLNTAVSKIEFPALVVPSPPPASAVPSALPASAVPSPPPASVVPAAAAPLSAPVAPGALLIAFFISRAAPAAGLPAAFAPNVF